MSRAYRPLPPAEWLWEHFDYKPLTGELIRRSTGRVTGHAAANGYVALSVSDESGKRLVYAHRLIWKWMTGVDPEGLQVDHRNRDRSCNMWINLRLSSNAQNQCNAVKRGRDLPKGVSRNGSGYCARIKLGGEKQTYLGQFRTVEDAHAAYCKAAQALHGEFSRTS